MSAEGLGVLEMEVLEGEVGLHDAGGLHPGPQHILLGGDVVGPGYPLQVIQVAGEGAEVSQVVGQGTSHVLGDILGVAPGTNRSGQRQAPGTETPPIHSPETPYGLGTWGQGRAAPRGAASPSDDAAAGTRGTQGDEAAAPGPAQP